MSKHRRLFAHYDAPTKVAFLTDLKQNHVIKKANDSKGRSSAAESFRLRGRGRAYALARSQNRAFAMPGAFMGMFTGVLMWTGVLTGVLKLHAAP